MPDRCQSLIAAQTATMAVTVMLAGRPYAGLIALMFVTDIGLALNKLAQGAMVPEVVPWQGLVQATAPNDIGFNPPRTLGPALDDVPVRLGPGVFMVCRLFPRRHRRPAGLAAHADAC